MLWDILRLAVSLILIYAGIKDIRQRIKNTKLKQVNKEIEYINNVLIPFRNNVYSKYNVDAFAFVEIYDSPIPEFVNEDKFSSCIFIRNSQIVIQRISAPELIHEISLSDCTKIGHGILQKNSSQPMFFLHFNTLDLEEHHVAFITHKRDYWINEGFASLMDAQPLINYLENNIPHHN